MLIFFVISFNIFYIGILLYILGERRKKFIILYIIIDYILMINFYSFIIFNYFFFK